VGSVDCASVMLFFSGVTRGKCLLAEPSLHCLLVTENAEFSAKGPIIRATFSFNLSRNNVALQVEIACCAYYHRLGQQISMLQKVDVASTFCNMKICCAQRW